MFPNNERAEPLKARIGKVLRKQEKRETPKKKRKVKVNSHGDLLSGFFFLLLYGLQMKRES